MAATMNVLEFTLLVWLGGLLAGLLGALTGLGGGVVLVPLLSLVFRVDLRYAIGTSLVSVIATSCGAAAAYVKEGYTNLRIGMFLEIATTLGALGGAWMAALVPTGAVAILFGIVLLWSAWFSHHEPRPDGQAAQPDPWAKRLRLDGSYPTPDGPAAYHVRGVPGGLALMALAGVLSGLLGIGSGAMKVLAMDRVMRIPFKVSTTTSNFMIGVTAAASAGVYLRRGYVDPGLVMPVMLGVLAGAWIGARLLPNVQTGRLRLLFTVVILALAVEMIYSGWSGRV